jgi:RNA polymerase sigma-70 factor (ECF subfamily)
MTMLSSNASFSPRTDRALVAQLVTCAWPAVQGVLRRMLGVSDPEYEDILQSSLERVVETVEHARRRNYAIPQWAAVVTRNVAVDALRARSRERRFLSRDDEERIASCPAGADPERVASARESLARFASALGRLRSGSAQVVYMHDVLGHDLAEVATTLGVSVAAAQSRLVRGRRQLTHGSRSGRARPSVEPCSRGARPLVESRSRGAHPLPSSSPAE